jgi:hypothetical protein
MEASREEAYVSVRWGNGVDGDGVGWSSKYIAWLGNSGG